MILKSDKEKYMLRSLLLTTHLSYLQAAFYATLAYFLFAMSDGFAKLLMADGFDRALVLVVTSLPSLLLLVGYMIYRNGLKKSLRTQFPLLHLIRCAGLVGVTYFAFMALQYLPLTDFYGVVFATPLAVTLGAFLCFKERISMTELIVIIIGFCGTLIVAQPDYGNYNVGYLFGFGAVICVSISALAVRKIGRREDPYLYVIFANAAIIAANIIPAFQSELPAVITSTHIGIFTIYCFTIPMAILILSAVFSRAPTLAAVAPFQYSQIIWGTIFGYLVFHDIPKLTTVIGSAIVIASGLYILFYHRRQRRQSAQ